MDYKIYELGNCQLMRIEDDTDHYYYGGQKEGGEKIYFLSVTKVLDLAGPFPEGLRMYLRVTNYEEQTDRLRYTADRGSSLHAALDKLMNAQELDLREFITQFEKDAVVTFVRMMRFLTPTKFKTELVVADPDLRIAGTLDFEGYVDSWKLTCLLEPNKYLETDSDGDFQLQERWIDLPKNSKRQRIIIDWKFTGRNAYSHKVQVAAYKTMFNKSYKGNASRAFTWRYSQRHKFGFDFQESLLDYQSFKRIYNTCIEFLGEFPNPPQLKKYPERVRLFLERKNKNAKSKKQNKVPIQSSRME